MLERRERSAPTTKTETKRKTGLERAAEEADRQDLAACREKVAARSGARGTSSAPAAPPGDTPEDAGERIATALELEAELAQCRKSEVVVSAEVCVAAARQYRALLSLPQNGRWCGPKSRAADLIEENFEHCATLADVPEDFRSNDLTKEQSSLVSEAIRIHKTLPEDEVLRRLKEFVWTCTETPKSTTEPEAPRPL
ncbi:hypothetical protein [Polyangium jinanense]|uniref:Uncharacterized protein n=1 Tax=Polyangium jinanense TaxID=2829994 RepID=A0A9X3X7M0_9BACT|nr:hypothetical protein [Polyangium jinanense]MDC3954313.1 hypothetical protein [Polyangium jinanense]MDC3984235.1 hypothetical protein [Polyangium jinanense]